MARNEARTRTRSVCEDCDEQVDRAAAACPRCGAQRPAGGWPVVADLRVYSSPDGATPAPVPAREPEPDAAEPDAAEPDAVATDPPTPARDEGPPVGEPQPGERSWHGAGLGVTFGASFLLTAGVVLGGWFGWLRPQQAVETDRAPVVVQPVVPSPVLSVPLAAASPPVEDASGDSAQDEATDETATDETATGDAVADAGSSGSAAAQPVVQSEPRPAPIRRPTPEPRQPARRAAPPPAPEADAGSSEPGAEEAGAASPGDVTPQTDAAPEQPAAKPAPQPTPRPPAAVRAQEGLYVGRVQGRPGTLQLDFHADGTVKAVFKVNRSGETQTSEATGTWILADDDTLTLALVETAGDSPRGYSGTVDTGSVKGKVTQDGRGRGRFHASR